MTAGALARSAPDFRRAKVVVVDKAYVDFVHLHDLDARGVQWVTRAKDNLCCRPLRNLPLRQGGRVIKDQIVKLTGVKWQKFKGWTFRLVEAWVEVDGQERLMVFISNNTAWSAGSVCDLYRSRWAIEVFFKQVKQTLKLGDFLGHKCQRHPLAGVVGPAGVCAAALCGAHQPVGAQLHTPLCRGACGTLGAAGTRRTVAKLWDSGRQLYPAGGLPRSVAPRLCAGDHFSA